MGKYRMSQSKGPTKQEHQGDLTAEILKRVSAPKRRKNRKSKQMRDDEAAWTPAVGRRENRPKSANSYKPKAPIAQLNGILTSPSSKVEVVTKHRMNLRGAVSQGHLKDYKLNTPTKGIRTSALVSDDATLLRARTIETHNGPISIFLSEDKVDHGQVLDIPKVPDNLDSLLDELGMPELAGIHSEELPITLKQIQQVRKVKSERSKPRDPSNKQVMKVSANVIAKALGFDGEGWQWWHLKGHSLFGDIMQRLDNFCLGMHHGNAKMNDLAESLIESLLRDKRTPDKLYLATDAEFVPGFERARLCSKVTWTIKDGPGDEYQRMVRYEFNPLSTDKLSKSEIEVFKETLMAMFFGDEYSPVKIISPFKGKNKASMSASKPQQNKPFGYSARSLTYKFDLLQDKVSEEEELTEEVIEEINEKKSNDTEKDKFKL